MYEGNSVGGVSVCTDSYLVATGSSSSTSQTCTAAAATFTTIDDHHHRGVYHGVDEDGQDYFFTLSVSSQNKNWLIRRTYRDFRKFDRQLHKCVYDRKFSQLEEIIKLDDDVLSIENLEVSCRETVFLNN